MGNIATTIGSQVKGNLGQIIPGAGALGGLWAANKMGFGGPSKAEQGFMGQAHGAAGQLGRAGGGLLDQGQSAVGKGANYYSTLLNGSRSQIAQALQPERQALSDTYRGAERGIERSGARGAAKDMAVAELQRQKAGQIGGLAAAVRPGAAQALTQIGQTATSQGLGATQGAASIYDQLLGRAGQQADRASEARGGLGEQIGSILSNIMKKGGTAAVKKGVGSAAGKTIAGTAGKVGGVGAGAGAGTLAGSLPITSAVPGATITSLAAPGVSAGAGAGSAGAGAGTVAGMGSLGTLASFAGGAAAPFILGRLTNPGAGYRDQQAQADDAAAEQQRMQDYFGANWGRGIGG